MAFGLKATGCVKWLVWSGWATLATALLVLPPLAGAFLTGKPLAPYLNIMPSTFYIQHPPFSWPIFILLTLLVCTGIAPFLYRLFRVQLPPVKPVTKHATFPWWGWLGAVLLLFSWTLAWISVDEQNQWQRYTFTPLWIGYILLMNALSVRRRGRCLMLSRPRKFLLLFAVSALFWWFFEYLNQFVHNWYYVGLGDISPLSRILSASLSFSTVLPAVLSTTYWLATFNRMQHAYTNYWTFKISYPRVLALIGLIASTLSLFALGGWPAYFYPLIWLSPLIVLLSLQVLAGYRTVFSPVQHGDWRPVCLPILAGLQCGFCWELWNYGSTAHWQYSIPYVDRFHLFEMPLLGYAGYFTFGLECILIASLLGVEAHSDVP